MPDLPALGPGSGTPPAPQGRSDASSGHRWAGRFPADAPLSRWLHFSTGITWFLSLFVRQRSERVRTSPTLLPLSGQADLMRQRFLLLVNVRIMTDF